MKAKQTGFTLIELMFTIMVLAVLLGIGVPNFREFVRNSRMTAAANDLLGDLSLARSEAVKRRAQVTVCGTGGGSSPSCSTSGTEFSAWMVFVDSNSDNTYQTSETLLRQHELVGNGITGTSDSLRVSYRHNGFPTPGSATQILFCDSRKNAVTVGNLPAARAVNVGASGRAGVTRPSTGCL
jgi:type IV fimbrial biogenesis protein FimT